MLSSDPGSSLENPQPELPGSSLASSSAEPSGELPLHWGDRQSHFLDQTWENPQEICLWESQHKFPEPLRCLCCCLTDFLHLLNFPAKLPELKPTRTAVVGGRGNPGTPWMELSITAGPSPASVFNAAVEKPSLTSQEPESELKL